MNATKTTKAIIALALCAAGISNAADFPLAGGDLASPTDWGQAVPGSSDDVVLMSSGTYTLGGDVAFKTLAAGSGASSLVFDFAKGGNHTVTLHGTTAREVLKPVVNDDGTVVFKGGVWKFNTPVDVAMPWKKRAKVVLTDGCMVTNVAAFNLGWGATLSRLDVTNGASLYSSGLSLNEWGNPSNVLSITAGGIVSVHGNIYSDKSYVAGAHGGNGILVSGIGSKLLQTRPDYSMSIGWIGTNNWLRVEDGGECSVTNILQFNSSDNEIRVCNNGTISASIFQISKSGNSTVVSSATLTAAKMSFKAGSSNNVVRVQDGATATIGDTLFSSGGNRIEVCNANYMATNSVQLGDATAVKGNEMRVTGPEAVFNCAADVFGKGFGNLFELTDGATWRTGGVTFEVMSQSSNNVLRVTGGAILDATGSPAGNNRLRVGGYWSFSGGNTLEILDGATVNVEALSIAGVDNGIVVSNATLRTMSSDAYGIWLGHGYNDERGARDKLIVKGATPNVRLKEYKSSHGSTIRFEIPVNGYAEGFVPVTVTTIDGVINAETEKIEIDCAAWAAKTGGKLTLIRAETAFSQNAKDWIAGASGLPSDCELVIENNDHDLVLRSPSKAATVIYMR